jgi:hypothetical protein
MKADQGVHQWESNPSPVPAGLVVRFLFAPTPCEAPGCGHTSYVRASRTTDKCARCGKERDYAPV